MCLAVLGRVMEVTAEGARVKVGERAHQAATLLVPDVAEGDDVLVTGGIIVARLSPEEAEERRRLVGRWLDAVEREHPPESGARESMP